ncbi:transposase [Geminicoccus harenae]|nr:transposase [Geminicoccus harenae]
MVVARGCVPLQPTKHSHPTYPAAGLFAALLLRERLRLTYRGLEAASGIWPADRTGSFEPVVVRPPPSVAGTGRSSAAGDGPAGKPHERIYAPGRPRLHCLWLSHTSRYFAWRAQRHRGQRGWLKWVLALWIEPQMLLAQRVRPGPAGDFSDLVPLASKAADVMPYDQLIADAGYDSEANHRFCREQLGADSLIPAKKRRSAAVVATTPYRQEMVRRLSKTGNPADCAAYRQRWKVETVMSVVKRRCGEALTARLEPTQQAQALLRGIAYNIQRLVILGSSS